MSPNHYQRDSTASYDVREIERWKKKLAHASHPIPPLAVIK